MGVITRAQGVQTTYKLTFILDIFLEGWSPSQVGRDWSWTRASTSATGQHQSKAI